MRVLLCGCFILTYCTCLLFSYDSVVFVVLLLLSFTWFCLCVLVDLLENLHWWLQLVLVLGWLLLFVFAGVFSCLFCGVLLLCLLFVGCLNCLCIICDPACFV